MNSMNQLPSQPHELSSSPTKADMSPLTPMDGGSGKTSSSRTHLAENLLIPDQAIQAATASERLTLEEEYENQQSWRVSHDKLTFIICQPLSPSSSSSPSSSTVQAGEVDIPEKMIGDINLFLYPNDEEDAPEDECVGEVDIMIASAEHRGKGLGRAVVGGFLQYISRNLEGILREYYEGGSKQNGGNNGGKGGETVKMKMLMAKINKDNVKSIKLFKALGFEQEGEVNYFGEVKLVLRDLEGYARGNVPEGYQEVVYQREE